MEESIYKGLDDFNRSKTCLKEDDVSSVNTDIPSDPWLDDKDINFCTSFLKSNKKTESNNENFSFFSRNELEESNLKENEIDLYNDLIVKEDEEKRSKFHHDSEVENLKKELEKLREADVIKSKKISELSKENTNLKKSICSLYQTVKSEIEHKDQLLAEANRKIDNILFRKNSQNVRNDKSTKTSSSNNTDASNQNSHKRKRSPEPRNEKESESSFSNSKNSNVICDKRTKRVCDRDNLKTNYSDSQLFENCDNPSAALQAPEDFEVFQDSTETNNLFFNILPASLRKAFYEYEQSQIISLNKLKQSYINEYFSADKCSTSKTEFSSKRANDLNTFFQNHNSVSGSHSTPKDKTVVSHKSNGENCRVTTSMQKDLVTLFKYRKERIPFLDKRKFGLLKEGKALIPENLL